MITVLVDDDDYTKLMQGYRWYADKYGYAVRNVWQEDGTRTTSFMHREIIGAKKGEEADHRNGNIHDNRRENLRLCTRSQNNANRHKIPLHSSRFKGVGWEKGRRKWQVRIKHQGKRIWLGYFDSEEAAAKAYDAKARELFGEFAATNNPV